MLTVKNMNATLSGDSGGTGQNYLWYDPNSSRVFWSSLPLATAGSPIAQDSQQRVADVTSTDTFVTYQSTATEPAGRYFVMVTYIYFSSTTSGILQCRILNNSTATAFGDLGDINVPVANARCSGGTCGISVLTNSNTFSFQFRDNSTNTVVMNGCTITCIRISSS